MATMLYRLGRTAYRRWPLVLVGWLVALLAVGGFAATQSKPMTNEFTIPGIPSLQAAETQQELFPGSKSADEQVDGQVVVQAPAGSTLAEQPYKGQVDRLVAELRGTPQLAPGAQEQIVSPVVAGPAQRQQMVSAATKQGVPQAVAEQNAQTVSPLSQDRRTGVITFSFDTDDPMSVEPATQAYVERAVERADAGGLTVAAGGRGMEKPIKPGATSEMIGVGIALIVLVLTFGSLVAAGLPILTAITGVGLGLLGITAATAFFELADTTITLASMIGLAVGIDYALFILSRYRTELRHTDDRAHAMGRALGTAGSAVVFAGLTVVIALSGLSLLGISMLTSMGLAAAATVVIAVLVALTLLPAIMGLLKHRAFAGRIRRDPAASDSDHHSVNGSVRLGRTIRRAPWLAALLVIVGLGALALPAQNMYLGLPSDATAEVGTSARTSADLVADGFGAGRNAPMVAVVDARERSDDPQSRAMSFNAVAQWAANDPGVANAQVVQVNESSDGGIVLITPKTGPADQATDDLLQRLRDGQGTIERSSGTDIGITGMTAIQADISEKLNDALPAYLAIVVGLALLLLVVVFRSILVPLLATGGFLLSVLATLGVTVKIVQDGLFGIFDPQPIMSFMPTILIGIVFGLAMDYQVFLTTRMREAYVHGMDARDAVIDGFRHSGRVVTAAALIMISVFAAFAFQDNALISSIGVALATAVFLDAFLVRMVLLPSLLLMLGDKAWWMPRWLDRILPSVDVEGEALTKSPPRHLAAEDRDGEPSLV
ncbi:multidrug RND transporter [Barrientosiimonas endolithica]|uniref:Multidrug RND transporter n=2 Tax=Barrientosiimonas endolithica TaxID=1535208 RepID=A0ABN6YMC5_9MICO|nr:multidrug RND transporter [Barrientosiimonas endolithica]